jgi:hypothetical protein
MIPQPVDYKIAAIEDAAAGVATTLRILRHSGGSGDLRPLRERLQAYVNLVMETAHDLVDSE